MFLLEMGCQWRLKSMLQAKFVFLENFFAFSYTTADSVSLFYMIFKFRLTLENELTCFTIEFVHFSVNFLEFCSIWFVLRWTIAETAWKQFCYFWQGSTSTKWNYKWLKVNSRKRQCLEFETKIHAEMHIFECGTCKVIF